MTSEIVIMNKEAVTFAADSAVTLSSEKIYTSASKIFALSKFAPIGIMIYGNTSFMDIPWEIIIKVYREKLGKSTFGTVEEYVNDFTSFLKTEKWLSTEKQQENYIRVISYDFLNSLKLEILNELPMLFVKDNGVEISEILELFSKKISEILQIGKHDEKISYMDEVQKDELLNKYDECFSEVINTVFEKISLNNSIINQLKEICVFLVLKCEIDESGFFTGVLIAGFGEEEIFPSLIHFRVEGIIVDKFKYEDLQSIKIDFDINSFVGSFAQSNMVKTFMEGIDPHLLKEVEVDLTQIFKNLPEILLNVFDFRDDIIRSQKKKTIEKIFNETIRDYLNKFREFCNQNFIQPAVEVIGRLPKKELPAIAESLLNIETLKKKISWEAETVGGSIDVAVITKGDGLIWIKRKHYFEAELNPRFLNQKY